MTTKTYTIHIRISEVRSVTVTVDDQHQDMLATAYDEAREVVDRHPASGDLVSREVTCVTGSHNLIRTVVEHDD